jgi:hypothetical protein
MKIWALALGLMMMCLVCARPSDAQQVDFEVDEILRAGDFQLPYRLNLELSAAAPTRVGVNALLDLREIQKAVPERLADNALVDSCGLQVRLDGLSILADGEAIALDSLLGITRFDCGRVSKNDFRRGDQLATFSAKLSAVVSVELRDNCSYLEIPDLTLSAPESTRDRLLQENTLSEVKNFLLAAIDFVLSETPLCPELPEELASLDPSYYKGGPREIGEGGLGVGLTGSVDVSPSTIIDVLLVLQREGKIPAGP